MSMFVEYASKEDLAEYMGKKDVTELPSGADILIKRASELICIAMRNNYNPENDEHVEAAKLAVCAQCQDWIEREVSGVSNDNISSYSLGELSITYSNVDKLSNKLNTTAVRYLNYKHLLYKGMGWCYEVTNTKVLS